MNHTARSLMIAAGFALAGALPAYAQFIELVTESPVTVTGSITTAKIVSPTQTTAKVTQLKHADIVADIVAHLRQTEAIDSSAPTDGWNLVLVNFAPPEVWSLDAGGRLFVVNGNLRVPVPPAKFAVNAYPFRSARKYKERHLGRYFLDTSGTVTNHVSYHYAANASVDGAHIEIDESLTDGFASINFKSKDEADGFEVFFLAVSSLRGSVRGSFATAAQGAGPGGQGLISLNFATSAAKLVPAANYPGVPTYPDSF